MGLSGLGGTHLLSGSKKMGVHDDFPSIQSPDFSSQYCQQSTIFLSQAHMCARTSVTTLNPRPEPGTLLGPEICARSKMG